MGRKFFVGGNWKMNGDKASIDVICDFLVKGPTDPNVEVVVSCSPCYLMYVRDKLPADKFGVAAQNCHKAAKGAFTGKYLCSSYNMYHCSKSLSTYSKTFYFKKNQKG